MNYRAHLFIGISLGAAISLLAGLSLHDAALFCAVCAASSLLPDLDIKNSKASQAAYAAALVAAAALSFQQTLAKGAGLPDFAAVFMICLFTIFALDLLFRPRHRGVMHSLGFLLALCAACLMAFGALMASALFFGYLSHLIADGALH